MPRPKTKDKPITEAAKAADAQRKNIAWYLPRPKPDHYKGGMPLHAEGWLIELAKHLLKNPDAKVMNLFCGMNTQGFRVDLNPEVKPDLLCDAHRLSEHLDIATNKFDVILADPPYSDDESRQLYGTPTIHYLVWAAEATKFLTENGLLIVYHKYIMPNPNPDLFGVVKRVFIGSRAYHVPRVAIFFQRGAKYAETPIVETEGFDNRPDGGTL